MQVNIFVGMWETSDNSLLKNVLPFSKNSKHSSHTLADSKSLYLSGARFPEHGAHTTFPQARQWWRRTRTLNSTAQF